MMFTKRLRAPIMRREITCSVRIWRRPRVKVGGRYRLGEGFIEVTSIRGITLADVTPELARRADFFGVVDIGELSMRLGLRQTRILLARGLRLGQFLVVTGDSWGPISEREHQSLGAIRRLNAALSGLIFGFNLDLAARVDLIANRRE